MFGVGGALGRGVGLFLLLLLRFGVSRRLRGCDVGFGFGFFVVGVWFVAQNNNYFR